MRNLERWLFFQVHGRAPIGRIRKPRRGPVRDYRYRAFIRLHPCAACATERGIECAHTGPHGLGIKAPDTDSIALCWFCHWGSNYSLHRIGPREFERLHELKIGALVKEYQAEWKDINERGREL
jgi:hypothetical protein